MNRLKLHFLFKIKLQLMKYLQTNSNTKYRMYRTLTVNT